MISIPNKEENARTMNVLGGPLEPCSKDPMTGFYRTGCCETGPDDQGRHVVCIVATESFLEFSRSAGNDLSTPMPEYGFPGIKPGDQWCLCAARWKQALDAGCAPEVVLKACHQAALELIEMEDLEAYAIDT